MISETLLEQVKRKCYITDTTGQAIERLRDIITEAIPVVQRMIGVASDFDFEKEGNEEELKLFKNYCWYDWNDCSNEFEDNYLSSINSLHHKHEVEQYDQEENE